MKCPSLSITRGMVRFMMINEIIKTRYCIQIVPSKTIMFFETIESSKIQKTGIQETWAINIILIMAVLLESLLI